MIFADRFAAAKELAKKLARYRQAEDAIVLTIPRGGLQVGSVLAEELELPLDIILTKKIGYPGQEEYAIGAVSLKSMFVAPKHKDIPHKYITSEVARLRKLLQERYVQYKGNEKTSELKDKIVIITDDGVATGSTLMTAVKLVQEEKPKKIVVAIPVGSRESIEQLQRKVDEMICLLTPEVFFAIGQFYASFPQVTDEEAISLLRKYGKKERKK